MNQHNTLDIPTSYEIRAELDAIVRKELLGPVGGETEEVNEPRIANRYLVGMLAPKRQVFISAGILQDDETTRPSLQSTGEGKDDELPLGGNGTVDDGTPDFAAPQRESLFPSSFGMTFSVDRKAKEIVLQAKWGHYERTKSDNLKNPKTGDPLNVWKRTPVIGTSKPLLLKEGYIPQWVVESHFPDVFVQGKMRRYENDWIITLFLVNNQIEPAKSKDEAWLFQAELSVKSVDGSSIFVQRMLNSKEMNVDAREKLERDQMNMVYRNHVEFAVGHGVSVRVQKDLVNPLRAKSISTCVIPNHEVPRQTPPTSADIPALSGLVLDMKVLFETPTELFSSSLKHLPDAYEQWIKDQKVKVEDSANGLTSFNDAAKYALDLCSKTAERIKDGIALLVSNPQAADAFRFANKAMWLQRIHSLYSERIRRGQKIQIDDVDKIENRTWYPFQLAFILINLRSLTDLNHNDRSNNSSSLADLLWFPTGGGKTEAYLGLTAYVLGIRRLQGIVGDRDGENGVAVLMRYTLRLLTLQQFQRATALICACESIRNEDIVNGKKKWGETPFRVGLWVGYRTTPNTTEQSAEAIRQAHGQGKPSGIGTPHQLTNCPWCGTKIEPGRNIKVETMAGGRGRTFIYCGDPLGQCLFTERRSPNEGLPILLVDDEIYRLLPSLLIATVDKFAQMPWNGKVQMLFGQINGYCPRHGFRSPEIDDKDSHQVKGNFPAVKTIPHLLLRPIDLIIQDELHLISGPLGTLVGLYETAINELCTWDLGGKKITPKIIASTATIRRSYDQVKQVFNREVNVFPPQGVDIEDNFFSLQRIPSVETPGRLYIGICAPGIRLKAVLIRVYTALLAATQQLYEKHGKYTDPWMTLVGYFNSLRELGGMRRLVDDDIRTRLQQTDLRGLATRKTPVVRELTSRIAATGIPDILDLLESVFDPAIELERERQRKAGERNLIPTPIDVLLATNMISVGVDVKRLGLMAVAGQPKTTSEYIQATSRVGRSTPGIVVTIYNWARPRDLSHYETFSHYHSTFYKHVEALSVTPYSRRALDRALTAVLVGLIRLMGNDFNANQRAQGMISSSPIVIRAIESILARAGSVTGETNLKEETSRMLQRRIDVWQSEAQTKRAAGSILGYEKENDGRTLNLLKDAGLGAWEIYTCLNSLRDVEPSVGLILNDLNMDN